MNYFCSYMKKNPHPVLKPTTDLICHFIRQLAIWTASKHTTFKNDWGNRNMIQNGPWLKGLDHNT